MFTDVLDRVKDVIIVPIIELLFVVALLLFLWGVVQYILNLNNPTGKETGKQHMVWGVVGLAIMLSAFGIVNFVFHSVVPAGQVGIDGKEIQKPDIIKQNNF